jgi:hypothetical protein
MLIVTRGAPSHCTRRLRQGRTNRCEEVGADLGDETGRLSLQPKQVRDIRFSRCDAIHA